MSPRKGGQVTDTVGELLLLHAQESAKCWLPMWGHLTQCMCQSLARSIVLANLQTAMKSNRKFYQICGLKDGIKLGRKFSIMHDFFSSLTGITKFHKVGGFRQQRLLPHNARSWKSEGCLETQACAEDLSWGGFFAALRFWHEVVPVHLCHHHLCHSSCAPLESNFPFLPRTPILGLGYALECMIISQLIHIC